MARSYQGILRKVKPLYEQHPERFMRFYNQVFLILSEIPEGGAVLISEKCTERSRELFEDVAEMCIIEERAHHNPGDSWLDFSEDRKWIIRNVSFHQIHSRRYSPLLHNQTKSKGR